MTTTTTNCLFTETPEEKRLRERLSRGKRVLQYDLKGNFIAEYLSQHQAQEATGVNIKAISNCCKGIYQQSNGFQFVYKGDENKIKTNLLPRSESTRIFNIETKGICIAQYDKDMNLVKKYDSINQAHNDTGYNYDGIQKHLDTNTMWNNYYWKRI